jgi:hypothetical protein
MYTALLTKLSDRGLGHIECLGRLDFYSQLLSTVEVTRVAMHEPNSFRLSADMISSLLQVVIMVADLNGLLQ